MFEEQKGALEAEELIENLGFDALPIIPNEVAASIDCDHFRVVLEEKEFDSPGILGKAIGDNKGALIYVNAKIPDQRRINFTAAHELGHVCMHIMHQKKCHSNAVQKNSTIRLMIQLKKKQMVLHLVY